MNNQLNLFLKGNPYFRNGEAKMLCQLMSELPLGPRILEIGTFRGWSAILMARTRPDAFIVTVDPHVGIPEDELSSSYAEVVSNFVSEKVESRIAHHPCSSHDYNPVKEFDLLFIDGDHTFAGVKYDFEKFSPYVKPDGVILFHDFGYIPGVTEFCKTLNYRSAKRFKSFLFIRKCNLC